MKVLCTGGAGYVGSACLRYLLNRGYDAYALDNLSNGNRAAVPDSHRRLLFGDVTDGDELIRLMTEHRFDVVMHLAALVSVSDSVAHPDEYWRVNLDGTRTLLQAMTAAGIDKIIYSSTAAVYDPSTKMPLTEGSPTAPTSPYGLSKRAGEELIESYGVDHGMGFTIFRYFNASGADENGDHGEDRRMEDHLVPLALSRALGRKNEFYVFGAQWPTRDGTCIRDYVHVADIAQAHTLAMESQEPGQGRIFNIGNGDGTTVLEVLQACQRATGTVVSYEITDPRPGDSAVLVADSGKLKSELGWLPVYDTIDSIVETACRWHSRHPSGYT